MKRLKRPGGFRFFYSLSIRIFLFLLLIIIGLFTVYSTVCSHLQNQILEGTIRLSAYRAGDLIYKSLYRLMLLNDRTNLFETIGIIGNEPGVERIRIYDKHGVIQYSTRRSETGLQVDMQAEACYVCHSIEHPKTVLTTYQKSRIFRTAENRRVLGLILPIYNAPECSNAACHAHSPEKSVLGVLDVQMSLSELDAKVAQTQRKVFFITLGFLLFGMVLIGGVVYLQTHRPIQTLKQGTERLAAGDMDYRIPLHRKDELGILAESFNYMAENLKKAYRELQEWSQTLEQKIEEKTREMEKINREMLHVERMASLGKMAATVAHELNNPLSGIVNYAKLLQKKTERMITDPVDRQTVFEQLELIRSESLRCGNIVRDLLIFARGSKINLQRCRLEDILKRALRLVTHHIQLANIDLQCEVKTEPEEIVCDPAQIEQALVALLVNAVEAMPGGGKLRIIAQNSAALPEHILLRISDTGVGISPEEKEKIFEPFYTTKTEQKSTGLGLAVVYGIVQRHHGRIWVESRKGKGTTFYIELPMEPPPIPGEVKTDENLSNSYRG